MANGNNVLHFRDLDAFIDEKINHIRKFVDSLKNDDLKTLSNRLRSLRNFTHDFEYWVDERIREQIESEAEEKVKDMLAAGFSFNSITVDKVRFCIGDTGEVKRFGAGPTDDDLPF